MSCRQRVLAFDVGGTSVKAAVVEELIVVDRAEEATDPTQLVEQLVRFARGFGFDAVQGVGLGVPGPLTPDRRSIAFASNLGLRGFPLADVLEQRLSLPVVMDDDANCAAIGEALAGAAFGSESSVTITVGTGIGAGVVVGGKVHRGAHAVAGEVGHVRVADRGRRCSCGGKGCLEAMANGAAVVAYAGGAFGDAAEVFAAAAVGDARARAAVDRQARYLGWGVALIASLIDPVRIVLAGSVGSQAVLAPLVRAAAAERCISPLGEYLDVRPAVLGRDAGVVGAAALVGGDQQ